MTKTAVLTSMEQLEKSFLHADGCVFPDDTAWFKLLEKYVLNDDDCLQLYYCADEREIAFMLFPLIRRYGRAGSVTLEAVQNYYSVDYRPVCSSERARKLIPLAIDDIVKGNKVHVVKVKPVDANAPESKLICESFGSAGWHVLQKYCQANWVHDISGTYQDYLESRGSRLRNTIRRKTKKLLAMPNVELEIFDGSENLDELLDMYGSVYDKSWKVKEPYPEFMPALIREIAGKGQLRLGVLKLDELPIAVHFWIVKHEQAYIYKLAHDPEYDKYSPGTVLMAEMIKYVIEKDKVKRLDFLSGDDSYKKDWMDDRLLKFEICAYNTKSVKGTFACLINLYIFALPSMILKTMSKSKFIYK